MLKLYDTQQKDKLEFQPANNNQVRLYTCGPTVYDFAHIGNMRSYIASDIAYRILKMLGYKVDWVMNITDIDDKTIKGTIKEFGPKATVKDLRTYTNRFYDEFLQDIQNANLATNEINFIRVTDSIAQIQEFITKLIEKGFAYKAEDGSTYFSIEKYQNEFGDYGKLVGEKFMEGKKVGARVKADEYEKEDLSDFALWKAHDSKDAQIFWDHPTLGPGRPGWHIECSVINQIGFEGQTTDIHTGGVDLIFPHHTNEIAQSQPLYKPFVNYWVHQEHLLVDNQKMAKRTGNFYTIADVKEKGFSALDFRYFTLTAHYRTRQNFTWEGLTAAQKALNSLVQTVADLGEPTGADPSIIEKYKNIITDDLNTPRALALIWDLLKNDNLDNGVKRATIEEIDKTLGLNLADAKPLQIPLEIKELIVQREDARTSGNYEEADTLRKQIEAKGYILEDTETGPKVRKS